MCETFRGFSILRASGALQPPHPSSCPSCALMPLCPPPFRPKATVTSNQAACIRMLTHHKCWQANLTRMAPCFSKHSPFLYSSMLFHQASPSPPRAIFSPFRSTLQPLLFHVLLILTLHCPFLTSDLSLSGLAGGPVCSLLCALPLTSAQSSLYHRITELTRLERTSESNLSPNPWHQMPRAASS